MSFKLLTAAALLATAAFADPIDGSWRRSGMRWDVKHSGKTLEVKVSATGGASYAFAAAADGKEYPVDGFVPGTTVKLLSLTPRGFETAMFRNGKELSRTKSTLSADGTILNSETFSNGSSSHMIFVHY